MGSEGFLPDLGRKGVYPPMFSEECASRFIPDGYKVYGFQECASVADCWGCGDA